MTPTDAPSSSSSSSREETQRVSAMRLPIEEPVEDLEDAVQKLRRCSSAELRRTRQRHRRAIEALQDGGYSSLSEATRERLDTRLRDQLEALTRALDPSSSVPLDDLDASNARESSSSPFFWSRFRAFFRGPTDA